MKFFLVEGSSVSVAGIHYIIPLYALQFFQRTLHIVRTAESEIRPAYRASEQSISAQHYAVCEIHAASGGMTGRIHHIENKSFHVYFPFFTFKKICRITTSEFNTVTYVSFYSYFTGYQQ